MFASLLCCHLGSRNAARRDPPTYFTLTHGVTEPTTLSGYDIPGNWSQRGVISSQYESEDDVVRIYRRICPRLRMAIIHVELMMVRMVQEFEWSTDPTERQVDFAGKLVFTVVMKNSSKPAFMTVTMT
ncbi:hypothetical protein DY000_02013843 [Brassica cretica]|uniref:Uncharacterized protein n=1 Tax=Brassica cretica TaxID=69181 RepID=A0ABQ7D031_BRACR|nr:hypothetical protein DY000_02013843 [Brassica cretica]